MLRLLAGALVLVLSPMAPAGAQTAPVAAAPEPARLAAAQALIEQIMPADRREAMIEQMVRPMLANAREAMANAPMFADMARDNPKLATAMNGFMDEEFERSIATTKAAMPALFDAMARAYARRFTLDQMRDIGNFFRTPSGRLYVETAPTIMSDPDVMAAQRAMMTQTMSGMQGRMAKLVETLEAEAKKQH
ncbi:DUF2059 domain-containing protein [Sphingomonas sp. 7/4-4]|uniref:DUF2059 domain-containing protein n=1 Tax=Sphingomonas sp. 7/4-4 TaxID=3018446 RepID=UPI0022F3E8C7|nr:DUF2059 domain-containing protein [Sphingomonas sp. 7/4-4]WBY07195.1 DUF2059 domain-containing protein [Sphingomonas sp. 7/4-4]